MDITLAEHWQLKVVHLTPRNDLSERVKNKVVVSCLLYCHCGALHYKAEGFGFDSRWRHCKFFFTLSFRPHYFRGIDSAP
jgi:hypothetical protein